ncbi:MAG: hypothetical protein FWD98_08095 [Defluviitaleaceae bacterium]|nr:hypothetical protein [Defluviitaleaceae bacterium]
MEQDDFRRECLYRAGMAIVREMLAEGLISEGECRRADALLLEKYRPILGGLRIGHTHEAE